MLFNLHMLVAGLCYCYYYYHIERTDDAD